MTVTITYEPVRSRTQEVRTCGSTVFISIMTQVFGDPPWILSRGQSAVLKAMSLVYSGDPNPYRQLCEAIDKYDSVEVTY